MLHLISCGNEAEQSTQELIDSADVDGLNKAIWNGQSNRGLQRTRFGHSCSQPIGHHQKTSTGLCDTVKPSELKHRISLQSIVKTNQNMLLQPEFMGQSHPYQFEKVKR